MLTKTSIKFKLSCLFFLLGAFLYNAEAAAAQTGGKTMTVSENNEPHPVSIPLIDRQAPAAFETATFGLG